MNTTNRELTRISLFLFLFLSLSFACNFSPLVKKPPIEQTADALATAVPLTQTAMQEETNRPTITRTPRPTITSSPTRPPTLTPSPEPTNTPKPPTATPAHLIFPSQPKGITMEITDTSSQKTADQGYVQEGDIYVNGLLLERPFTQEMKYRPDLDIWRAAIGDDDNFIYVNIHLQGVNPDTGTLAGTYGVELDFNADGRGDYLIWTSAPASGEWSIDSVQILMDANHDVGNKTPLKSDAPVDIVGDGYERALFSIQILSDPDAAWSRLGPDQNGIQIAFKKGFFDEDKFLWSVWADDGLKNPAMFDYNDAFTIEQAGSPLQTSQYYPLKEVYLVDNTCRSTYKKSINGVEPGLCGNLQKDIEPTLSQSETPLPNVTSLPDVTLPVSP